MALPSKDIADYVSWSLQKEPDMKEAHQRQRFPVYWASQLIEGDPSSHAVMMVADNIILPEEGLVAAIFAQAWLDGDLEWFWGKKAKFFCSLTGLDQGYLLRKLFGV